MKTPHEGERRGEQPHMVKCEAGKLEGGEVGQGQRQEGTQSHAHSAEADEERAGPRAVLVRHKYRYVAPVHRPGRPCARKHFS